MHSQDVAADAATSVAAIAALAGGWWLDWDWLDPAAETAITDLHVWRVGRASYACALSLLTHDAGLTPRQVRDWLGVHEEVVHATIEIHLCPDH